MKLLKAAGRRGMSHAMLDSTDLKIAKLSQCDLPLAPRPFARVGDAVGVSEDEALARVTRMIEDGSVRRVEVVYDRGQLDQRICICKLSVAREQARTIAAAIARHANASEIWLADGHMNVWFTLVADTETGLDDACREIESSWGELLRIAVLREFHTDFKVQL